MEDLGEVKSEYVQNTLYEIHYKSILREVLSRTGSAVESGPSHHTQPGLLLSGYSSSLLTLPVTGNSTLSPPLPPFGKGNFLLGLILQEACSPQI